ncbi:MAG TPA: hypothetical protein VJY15_01995 [Candidatus Acidoferrum sp.]|nr:hypothetical protein [Candidatus Acidoferrum sp.]
MEGSWKRVSGVAVIAVLACGMMGTGLQAGPAAGGKFKLPFDAQAGRMALPTGEYTFKIERPSLDGTVSIYRENRAVGMLRPQMFNNHENQGKRPVLVCIRHNGNVTVRALQLPGVGTFYFALPQELKMLVAQQPQLIETVSVEVSGD